MMVRFGIFLLWLLHFLPYRLQAWTGNILGTLLYLLTARRRRVANINLRLCFPKLSEAQRTRLVRQHFIAFGRSIVERVDALLDRLPQTDAAVQKDPS